MPLVNDDGEDEFFDSLDYIRNSTDSASSEDSVGGNSGQLFWNLNYEIWKEEPRSIHERRQRFLRGMGFDELGHSQLCFSQEANQGKLSRSSINFLGSERIAESSGAVLSCSSDNVEHGDSASGLAEADSGKKLDLSPLVPSNFSNSMGEFGSNRVITVPSHSVQKVVQKEPSSSGQKQEGGLYMREKKQKSWWKSLLINRHGKGLCKSDDSVPDAQVAKARRMQVQHRRKRFMEFSGLYMGQEIQAHKGFIWTMKFSPDGQFLASGGEDGVVRIWHVIEADASSKSLFAESTSEGVDKVREGKFIRRRKNSNPASVIIPEKVFKIEETPLHEFHEHSGDVLDLSWSKSNFLLSSSEDKTVRLWQVGCNECLEVFHHNNYVTCIQFNPVDERFFMSGSIDGKVRVWRVSDCRVVDWDDVRDIVTAVCYRPDGQGCIVGSITGNCRFYDASGNHLQLNAQLPVLGKGKSSCKRITGLQFAPEDSQRIVITSADSRVRVLDGFDVIHKYRGLRNSGSQMSASFTSNGRYIVSAGEDSRVYVWSYDGVDVPSSKGRKSVRSCEHFSSEGVSVAIPWSGMGHLERHLGDSSIQCYSDQAEHLESTSSWFRDSDRFSRGWFFSDSSSRASATWPEEKLPLWSAEGNHHHHGLVQHHLGSLSATWGLVIVTAGCDGVIRSFHNYGLPVRR